MTLSELNSIVRDCKQCPLARTRTHTVFGEGNEKAEVVLVGEAPGFYEDKEGAPFVGQAGKLLTQLLSTIGLHRSEVYIANVLKCRPPNNRDPQQEEIEACKPYLLKQLEIIKPRIVCTLGRFAAQTLLGMKVSITRVHGQLFPADEFTIFPIFHPAAALHQRWMLEPLKEDFMKLGMILKGEKKEKAADFKQLELFDK